MTQTGSGKPKRWAEHERSVEKEENGIMKTKKPFVNYRFMIIFAIVVGVIGIALLFLQDFEIMSLMLTLAALGGLIGGSQGYTEPDRQRLKRSFKPAFEWLLLVIMLAYAFLECSRWLGILVKAAVFLNGHWPGLIICIMCILIGMAGFQKEADGGSA
jgi:hypothetical protein